MTTIDWVVLVGTIATIAGYGIYKTRNIDTSAGYLKGDGELPAATPEMVFLLRIVRPYDTDSILRDSTDCHVLDWHSGP